MAEVSGHISKHMNVINVFRDVNSIFYSAGIHSNAFRRGNLTFFQITRTHSISKTPETPETRWKATSNNLFLKKANSK